MIPLVARQILPLMIALILCPSAMGQGEAQSESALASSDFRLAATSYEIATAEEPDRPLDLIPNPLLTWSNPERRTASGAVFLYVHRGQPQVAMCVYPNQGSLDHEFQSLSEEPLLAKRDGTLVWTPRSPGLEMQPFEGASPPGGNAVQRLREMRNLSRKFEGAIVSQRSSPKPLRLLSTPLYRYPAEGLPQGVVDGALFSFVQSTDPEILLVVEAREDTSGTRQWYFGLARMSMVLLSVQLDGKEIWTTEWAVRNPSSPYYTIGGN